MKKIMAVLWISLMVLFTGSASAFAAGSDLIDSKGVRLELLAAETYASGETATITLKVRGINNTDHKVWVELKDVTIDGVPVSGTLRSINANSDTGEDDPLLYGVRPAEGDTGAGAEAIRNGRELEMLVDVSDNDTYEHFIQETVTIDLAEASNNQSGKNSSSGTKAPAYTPASSDFQTLAIGSRGQAVIDLQQRLTDLGYLNDKVDGVFGNNTATAVMCFCTQHDLDISGGDATPEMQTLLYSSGAEYYVEPYVPLINGPRCKWDDPVYAELDNGNLYIQVVNRSQEKTIRGYELYYYKTDVWGTRYKEPTTGKEITQTTTFQQTIKPGEIVYSQPITILPFSWTYTVWIGIHKVVFEDGEIREIPEEDIDYFSYVIKN